MRSSELAVKQGFAVLLLVSVNKLTQHTVMRMVIRDLERICDSAVILFFPIPVSHEKKKLPKIPTNSIVSIYVIVWEWNDAQTNITTRKLEFDLQTDQLNTELHLAQWLS